VRGNAGGRPWRPPADTRGPEPSPRWSFLRFLPGLGPKRRTPPFQGATRRLRAVCRDRRCRFRGKGLTLRRWKR
jgi:hypothetical protein